MAGLMMIALAAAIQSAAPTVLTALSPSSRWSLDEQPGLCQLTRTFGSGDARVTFGLRHAPADYEDELILISYGNRDSQRRRGTISARFEPTGKLLSAKPFISLPVPDTDRRLHRFLMPRAELPAFDGAERMIISASGRPDVTLDLKGVGPAIAAVLECEAETLREWGVDPAAVATWPTPIGREWEWFRYPIQALSGKEQGETTARWMIDETGAVHDCTILRSSGNAVLDQAACDGVLRSARYEPALDKDGKPMPWVSTRRIVWALSNY